VLYFEQIVKDFFKGKVRITPCFFNAHILILKKEKTIMTKSIIKIGKNEFQNKIMGCWLGKSIGGTLGAPYECKKHTHALTYYDPFPKESAPNDDLDLQLVWLKAMEENGIDPSVRILAEYWKKYAYAYPWNEYGFFMRNFERGLHPPIAGSFENYFVDEMGSPIRSEIWACIHPADPQSASRMAWKDSALDHAGGEGTYGEMFWAAVESAAFVEKNAFTLIQIGLSMIPTSCQIARVIKDALLCYKSGMRWGEAREKIATQFCHIQPCNAIPNHGFEIIGWLYGKDYGDSLLKAVNCGYDTDCTGATLGAVLGIIYGAKAIPEKWKKPIGKEIVLHKFTKLPDAPKTLEELADRTIKLAEKSIKAKSDFAFDKNTSLPYDIKTRLFHNEKAIEAFMQDYMSAVELVDGKEVWLHYGGEPVLMPDVAKVLKIRVPEIKGCNVEMVVPAGWNCRKIDENRFEVLSKSAKIAKRNIVKVKVNGKSVDFTILGPQEAEGVAAGKNVEYCTVCNGRRDNCICKKR
jgi:ADP-ribosylglycohydrolase